MMISKNQGGTDANSFYGVFTIVLSTLIFVDAFFGGFLREYFSLRVVEYSVVVFFMIAAFRGLVKNTGPGGRLLRSYSEHGL